MTLWSWLLSGSDEQTLSKHWLQTRCLEHDDWTRSQQAPGMAVIVSDTRAMQRRAFWERHAAKAKRITPANVAAFRFGKP